MSVSYAPLWKQEKRLCFWMAVLALYERFLARSQDPAPREGRLMTASHGKALQQQRAKERDRVEDGRWRDEKKAGRQKGRNCCVDVGVIGVSMSQRCVSFFVVACASKKSATQIKQIFKNPHKPS